MKHKRICRYRQKTTMFLLTFLNFADRTKSGPVVMVEPDRCLYFIFQIVRVGCFRCDESIKCELSTEEEIGNEDVEGRFTVDCCLGVDVFEKAFLLLAGEMNYLKEEMQKTNKTRKKYEKTILVLPFR